MMRRGNKTNSEVGRMGSTRLRGSACGPPWTASVIGSKVIIDSVLALVIFLVHLFYGNTSGLGRGPGQMNGQYPILIPGLHFLAVHGDGQNKGPLKSAVDNLMMEKTGEAFRRLGPAVSPDDQFLAGQGQGDVFRGYPGNLHPDYQPLGGLIVIHCRAKSAGHLIKFEPSFPPVPQTFFQVLKIPYNSYFDQTMHGPSSASRFSFINLIIITIFPRTRPGGINTCLGGGSGQGTARCAPTNDIDPAV